jgi:hypothetical protein
LDIGWTSFPPNKADSPLVIDANQILARPVALQRFKAIAGRNTKIAQRPSLVEETQLAQRGYLHVEREPATSATRPNQGRLLVGEALNIFGYNA